VELVDITRDVQSAVKESGIDNGVCYIYFPHTTAGLIINEGADPAVAQDILNALNKLVPANAGYEHMEGNSDAHIKVSIVGTSKTVFVERGTFSLGTWQSIFFAEFDGPRNRAVRVKTVKE
jgi:secondary thiamine-phosphate synthase enzyme